MKKLAILVILYLISIGKGFANDSIVNYWRAEWPNTDFSKSDVKFAEIMSGGPPKDGIPAIDSPKFKPVSEIDDIGDNEPVISLNIKNDVRAYPIRILMFHEIVNDVVGEVPVSVTYCPLCNASLTFERTLDGDILDFGTTGKLRLSDMIMYDRQTESWWQQFLGVGIIGKHTGKKLKLVPSRIESFALFKTRYPEGKVLIPNNPNARDYGKNPYVKYDSEKWPFLFKGEYEGSVPPLSRVVAIGNEAWPLSLLMDKKTIQHHNITLSWQAGQNSALDSDDINNGKDIGNVTALKDGKDIIYHVPFAFAFTAFHPDGVIYE